MSRDESGNAQTADNRLIQPRTDTDATEATDRTNRDDSGSGWVSNRCQVCGEKMGWVACPTGGWWAHLVHPEDGHDAR